MERWRGGQRCSGGATGRRSVRWHQPRPTVATSKMETPDFTVILAIAASRDAGLGALLTQ
jgi:hypothetical protein